MDCGRSIDSLITWGLTGEWIDPCQTDGLAGQIGKGAAEGAKAGALNVADTYTGGRIDALHEARNQAFDDAGLTGTGWETGSNIAAQLSREALSLANPAGKGGQLIRALDKFEDVMVLVDAGRQLVECGDPRQQVASRADDGAT